MNKYINVHLYENLYKFMFSSIKKYDIMITITPDSKTLCKLYNLQN